MRQGEAPKTNMDRNQRHIDSFFIHLPVQVEPSKLGDKIMIQDTFIEIN